MFKDLIRKCLYASGVLGVYHRLRNADSLTVVMFHRILRPQDARWAGCDPEYTLAEELFAGSLAFFKRHYNVVSLADVMRARRSGGGLPPRALLITFDDGWRDNLEYALPVLQRARLPAVMFVAADAVGARQPFYQERIVSAWRSGRLNLHAFAETMIGLGGKAPIPVEGMPALRNLIAQLERMPPAQRMQALRRHADVLDDGLTHMIDVADLETLREGGIELGLHGKSHVPMTRATDLEDELDGARAALAAMLRHAPTTEAVVCNTMSFPHGAWDAAIAERARNAGYELQFTSVPVINPVGERPGWLLGRTGFEAESVTDQHGRFRGDWLAWYLFRRPAKRLA